jgi:phage terminase Nu1 subunit (DNA packaging protein)
LRKLVTRKELARILPCHPRSLSRWIEEGLPVAVRGRGGRASLFDPVASTAWVRAKEEAAKTAMPSFLEARTRQAVAQAVEAEQRVALRAGKLLPVEDVERVWSAEVAAVRARLLVIPTALADRVHRVATLEGAAGVERVLREEIYHALRELSVGKSRRTRTASRTRRTTKRRKPTVAKVKT